MKNTQVQIEGIKNQTIGVEVEMNNITRAKAAQIAAEFFGTHRHENTAGCNGYCTFSAWDSEGREWKFQKDVSIHGPDGEKCEMVTPILTYSDIETLQELIRRLRKAGAKSDATRGCGVHVHIGAQGHTPQSLRNLANIMASHESLLASALNIDRGRMNRYCRTVSPAFLEQLNRKSPRPWRSLRTSGTLARTQATAGQRITTTADTTCLTCTPLSPRARLSSGFSNLMHRAAQGRTDFTQDSSRATFSFV